MRTALLILVYGLALIFVLLGVVMGFYLVVESAGDQLAQSVLRWLAGILLFMGVTDLLLLVAILGLDALERNGHPPDRNE